MTNGEVPMLKAEEAYLAEFDVGRAMLRGPDLFDRFRVPEGGEPLAEAGLDPDTMLLVVERNGAKRAFLVTEMAYHHLAQGTMAGQPFLVSFCAVCHSGVGMVPVVEGTVHNFSAGGLYNGLVLLVDDESESYWDHIRGLALYGPLRGVEMETFPLQVTNVRKALKEDPELQVSRSHPRATRRLFGWMSRNTFRKKGLLPPGFRRTMEEGDDRLPEMSHGLGVMVGGVRRFYPLDRIRGGVVDEIGARTLRLEIDAETQIPSARWEDDGTRPMQIFSRWYGFAATYPKSQIYAGSP